MTVTTELDILEQLRPLKELIRTHAEEGEANHRLSRPVVDALLDAGAFRMLVPRSLGGLEVDPITFYRAVELLGTFDGSAGWCVFISAGGGYQTKFLPDLGAEEIWNDPRAIISGALFPFGSAVVTEGGYRVTGRWPYASGSSAATWLIGFCIVMDGDQPRTTPMGPEIRVMHVPRSEAEIIETWDVMGLSGTGSNDIVFKDVFVPDSHSWAAGPMTPRGSHFQSPLYRFPFMGIFAHAMGSVALGIAQAATEVALEVARAKKPVRSEVVLRERPLFQRQVADALAAIGSARSWLLESVGHVWEAAQSGAEVPLEMRATLQLAACHATRSAATAVDLAYTASGGSANYRTSVLQRHFRDVHAITQHAATSPQSLESAGRMLVGLPPDNPMILL